MFHGDVQAYGRRVSARVRTQRKLDRIEDMQFLRDMGLSAKQIAERMGLTKRTVERYLASER